MNNQTLNFIVEMADFKYERRSKLFLCKENTPYFLFINPNQRTIQFQINKQLSHGAGKPTKRKRMFKAALGRQKANQ